MANMLLGVVLLGCVVSVASFDYLIKPTSAPPETPCCWPKPRNCADLHRSGVRKNGVYQIYPFLEDKPAAVYCDMTTDGGGWTVFQKRFNGEIDFYASYYSYKKGFGSVFREYWWGNDKLHQLTSQEPQHLRIDLSDFNNQNRYAKFSHFGVADAIDFFRASIGGYSGNAGDSFSFIDGQQFSTKDADHDSYHSSCAQSFSGAYWYKSCLDSNLNGKYLSGYNGQYSKGMCWKTFRGYTYSLKTSEMKIRPANFV